MNERGIIFTFYSYKGGVGRSMALANVAALLAKWGRRVLIVDWDLEAPGIEKYFENSYVRLSSSRANVPGIIDIVSSYANGKTIEWKDCIIKAASSHFQQELSIISAGRSDKNYASKVQTTQWNNLFNETDFGSYLERLREEWIGAYDFVLIDSRTGITDIGGICTIHLPDIVVLMFTTNHHSLQGAKDVILRARKQHEMLQFDRHALLGIPVPARDESRTEYESALQWKKIFSKELADLYQDWIPKDKSPADIIDLLRIPYIPYWSFGERLPVLEEGTSDPTSIGFAFEVLSRAIAGKLQWSDITEGPIKISTESAKKESDEGGLTMDEQQYMQERVDDQISWYGRKSMANKVNYSFFSMTQILCGVAIPFIINLKFDWSALIASAMGLLVAFTGTFLNIFRYQENWLNYRATLEALKYEKYRFLAKAPPYDFEGSFKIFVDRVETLISKEGVTWQKNMERTKSAK